MTRDTAQAIWYRQLDPSCFSASDATDSTDAQSAATTPTSNSVPAAFANAWEPQHEQHGLTRLRAIFSRL